jgi:surfeit locus 1 family protein
MPPQRSLFWPSVVALGAFIMLIGLGTWQVERLFWKERLIAGRQAAVTAAPVALPISLDAAQSLEFHRVRAEGRFLNDRELDLGATSDDGHPGYHIVTPLQLADGTVVLVNRGFVPEAKRAPGSRAEGLPQGETRVTGLLRLPPTGKAHWFIPDNNAARNYWLYVDIPAMAAAAHLDHVLPFYVDADATPNPGGLPAGGQTPISLPNNHLQYAITWYALAAALVVVYVVLVRRHRTPGDHA